MRLAYVFDQRDMSLVELFNKAVGEAVKACTCVKKTARVLSVSFPSI